MILFAGGVYFVISLSASLLVSWLKKGLCNDYPEKRFKMVWSLSGADRLLHGSEKGEVVVVCGPSGSGKSTLIKTVNGLEPVQQGQIIVDGTVVNDKRPTAKLRSHVGMVFQHFELFPHLSIIDNLTLAQVKVLNRDKASARKKGLKLLERVRRRMRKNTRRNSPAASSSAWPLPEPCVWTRSPCCLMSPPQRLTRR